MATKKGGIKWTLGLNKKDDQDRGWVGVAPVPASSPSLHNKKWQWPFSFSSSHIFSKLEMNVTWSLRRCKWQSQKSIACQIYEESPSLQYWW